MPAASNMVGKNKGKNGKDHGLSCGINSNSTHEYGNNNNIVTKEI